jgi:hypothetical protein
MVPTLPEWMMSEPTTPANGSPEPEDEAADRRLANIVIVVGLALLIGCGWWLANAMFEARKADECISAGRRNCIPLDVPAR